MGRHSLEVFCVGLFLSYIASTAIRLYPAERILLDVLLSAAGIAVLMLFARWKDRAKTMAGALRLSTAG
jgi:hypothetical protein